MNDIIIPNKERLEELRKNISIAGVAKFHVVADFDGTLTKNFVNGKEVMSVVSVLRNGNYLSPEYRKKAHELANKYRPIEFDPKISMEEKKPLMEKWWKEHFELLIKSKLNKKDIEEVIRNREFEFREETFDFIDYLHENNIPMLIISASGLGDAIPIYLEKNEKNYEEIVVITNGFIFNEEGYAISAKQPIITSMNKDEGSLREDPIFKTIQNRKNVLLLGNSVADINMIQGFSYDNLIKIGFLNENVEENLKKFRENFDIILTGDADLSYVNKIIKEMFS